MRTFGLDTAVMVCLQQIGVTPASVLVVGSTKSTQVNKVANCIVVTYCIAGNFRWCKILR